MRRASAGWLRGSGAGLVLGLALVMSAGIGQAQDAEPKKGPRALKKLESERVRGLESKVKTLEARVAELERKLHRLAALLDISLSQERVARRTRPARLTLPERPATSVAESPTPDAAKLDSAVAAGLTRLTRSQHSSGAWLDAEGRPDTEATGLAILAFVQSGVTHRYGEHKRRVNRGLRWLRKMQKLSGLIGADPAGPRGLSGHIAATRALTEAFFVSRDYMLKKPTQKALSALIRACSEDAGWGLEFADREADILVTTEALETLERARVGGLDVPIGVLAAARETLERRLAGEAPISILPGDARGCFAMPDSAIALQLLKIQAAPAGASKADRALREQLYGLTPRWNTSPPNEVNLCTWWALARLAFIDAWKTGDPAARRWLEGLSQTLARAQLQEGEDRGAWPLAGPWTITRPALATSLALLSTELSQRLKRIDELEEAERAKAGEAKKPGKNDEPGHDEQDR